jgi:hypothetical protein
MKKEEFAYIAGFLDGDGSIMLQLKPRRKVSFGFRVRTIICFYQDKRYQKELSWIQKKLQAGYISRRSDNMIELRIEGHQKVKKILNNLYPFIIFKKEQAKFMFKAFKIIKVMKKPQHLLKICKISDKISSINYATTKKKYNYDFVKKTLLQKGLIPL